MRILGAGDEEALEAFLVQHADSSMFLRSNLQTSGLIDRGETYPATHAAALENGAIVAVAAHTWTGNLLLQAPAGQLPDVVRAAVARSGRKVAGLIGPWGQVVAARDALGFGRTPTALNSREILYALDLARLVVPHDLARGRVRCRRPRSEELDLLVDWRIAYDLETLSDPGDPAVCRRKVEDLHSDGRDFILVTEADEPVASSAFNAVLPDAVQVGGVWTPVALRRHGYARAVVAGSLLEARGQGARRGVLFTAEENWPAQRAYEALGFRPVGDYGLLSFTEPQPITLGR
ncbi:MAG: GNAT family N-acetyltransferase [Candidatus Rokuibacteriota bacterium]